MKLFRIHLMSGGLVYVSADHYQEVEDEIHFFRGNELVAYQIFRKEVLKRFSSCKIGF